MSERFGWAKSADGGYAGADYIVTTTADSGAGSLRAALESEEHLWITFAIDAPIELLTPIRPTSFKTIDGRGSEVVIKNHGLLIYDASDVIISHIAIVDGAPDSTDAIEVARSNNVWINHVTLANFGDGLIDIKYAPAEKSRVTVSNSLFTEHNKVSLVGLHKPTAPNDKNVMVTYAYNHFATSTNQRHPRVAQAYAHLLNNVISWDQSGVASYDNARVLSDHNWYLPTEGATNQAVDTHHGGSVGEYVIPDGSVRSVGDALLRDTVLTENLPSRVSTPSYVRTTLDTTEANMQYVIENAGSGYDYYATEVEPEPSGTVTLRGRVVQGGGAYTTDVVAYSGSKQVRLEWESTNTTACTVMNDTTGKRISYPMTNRTEANIKEPAAGEQVTISITCTDVGGFTVTDTLLVVNETPV